MEDMITIYKITSPSGRVYIGQTKNFHNRMYVYKINSCKSQTKLYNSFKKYGFDNHTVDVLEICENLKSANISESFFINQFNCLKNGLNIAVGGNRSPNYGKKLSDDHAMKISLSQKGRKLSEEHKAKISFSKKGKPSGKKGYKCSEEVKKRMSTAKKLSPTRFWLGKLRPEIGEKISKANKGKPSKRIGYVISKETKLKISNTLKGNTPWNKGIKTNSKIDPINGKFCKTY